MVFSIAYNSDNLTSIICLHTVSSICPIDRTLSGATTPSLSGATTPSPSGPGRNVNEWVLHISHISKEDGLMS